MRRRTLLAVLAAGIIATAVLAPVVTSFPETTRSSTQSRKAGPLSYVARIVGDALLVAAFVAGIVTAVRLLSAPVRREAEPEPERAKSPRGATTVVLPLLPVLLALVIWGGASMLGHTGPVASAVARAVSPSDAHIVRPQAEGAATEGTPAAPQRAGGLAAAGALFGIALVAVLFVVLHRRRSRTAAESPPAVADATPAESEPAVNGEGAEREIFITYREMCRRFAERSGTETLPFTPRQILRRIEESGIAASDAVALTHLFEETRYGHRPVAPETAASARRIGERVRIAFRGAARA